MRSRTFLCAVSALLLAIPPVAHAQIPDPPAETPAATDAQPGVTLTTSAAAEAEAKLSASRLACSEQAPSEPGATRNIFGNFGRGSDDYSIANTACGLSTHKPMFALPATYSPDYEGSQTELVFQISAKQRLFDTRFYFGYTQRSFFQVYDADRSRPFRETDYNPELFYRWTPKARDWLGWGVDVGGEHESNGQDVPSSRSWNRVYAAVFRARGKTGVYLKTWYRIPEDEKETPDDPKGDDNPDIEDFYGYGELHLQRQIGKQQLIQMMVRMNPSTGKGALNINYTIPSKDGFIFYQVYLWQGYGESLMDYNDSVTRIGIGVALAR